jgi:hypothetical protein
MLMLVCIDLYLLNGNTLILLLVNYVLRDGELFNMVLLVPDDIPEECLASTVEGNVEEMCALFKDWDPR